MRIKYFTVFFSSEKNPSPEIHRREACCRHAGGQLAERSDESVSDHSPLCGKGPRPGKSRTSPLPASSRVQTKPSLLFRGKMGSFNCLWLSLSLLWCFRQLGGNPVSVPTPDAGELVPTPPVPRPSSGTWDPAPLHSHGQQFCPLGWCRSPCRLRLASGERASARTQLRPWSALARRSWAPVPAPRLPGLSSSCLHLCAPALAAPSSWSGRTD